MELDKWTVWMKAQGLSSRTIGERLNTIRHLLTHASTDPLALTPEHIQAYLARDMSASTRATYHASIRAFTAWMQRTGIREDNPSDQTPRPKRPKSRPRPVEGTQLAALLVAANRKRTLTYILLGAMAGLRVHEIAKIRGEDIDPYTGVLTVVGKGGKVAAIPLHERLIQEAKDYPTHGYWFPAYGKQSARPHIASHAVSAAISKAMERAGFTGKPHQLRHFYGTELVRAGVNLRIVQTLMRHESPATTAIYTRVDVDQMRDGIALLALPKGA
ncbi:tyrosine-type recombinase/integrase [Streptomyces sp. AC495_CC817]|uniref:tyrosine-type recombinase/integrase n=1 Tax=Streptomyces sp. AC495_CC817 TaxID=2823900 RepID=UPI001C269CF8|nr:tyrosine-type recombinase/integrase [Streptomyces sp. AC495_CC817]